MLTFVSLKQQLCSSLFVMLKLLVFEKLVNLFYRWCKEWHIRDSSVRRVQQRDKNSRQKCRGGHVCLWPQGTSSGGQSLVYGIHFLVHGLRNVCVCVYVYAHAHTHKHKHTHTHTHTCTHTHTHTYTHAHSTPSCKSHRPDITAPVDLA